MTTAIKKWGNSLAVRIPQAVAEQVNLHEGVRVAFEVVDGKIALVPQTRKKYTLDDLLEGVTPEQFEGEMDWGADVGAEIW